MGFGLGVHGRMRVVGVTALRWAAPGLVTALLSITAVGCSTERASRNSAGTSSSGDSSATANAGAGSGAGVGARKTASAGVKNGAKARVAGNPAGPATTTNRVRLIQQVCIRFEPRWSTIRVGQSLTWSSELKSSVRIHVSPGAFDKTEYVVGPGAIVGTGPARTAGSYTVWSEPAACQGIPRGVQGPGPGVTVRGASRE